MRTDTRRLLSALVLLLSGNVLLETISALPAGGPGHSATFNGGDPDSYIVNMPPEYSDGETENPKCFLDDPEFLLLDGTVVKNPFANMEPHVRDELLQMIPRIPPVSASKFQKLMEFSKPYQVRAKKILASCGPRWAILEIGVAVSMALAGAMTGAALMAHQYSAISCRADDCQVKWVLFEKIGFEEARIIGAKMGAITGALWTAFGLTAQTLIWMIFALRRQNGLNPTLLEHLTGTLAEFGTSSVMFRILSEFDVGIPVIHLEKLGLLLAIFNSLAIFSRGIGGWLLNDHYGGYFSGTGLGAMVQALSLCATTAYFKKAWPENDKMMLFGVSVGFMHLFLGMLYLIGVQFTHHFLYRASLLPAIELTRPAEVIQLEMKWDEKETDLNRAPLIRITESNKWMKTTTDAYVRLFDKDGNVKRTFPVHKLVMMTSASLYRVILEGTGAWTAKNVIDEHGVSEPALKAFIEFLYKGEIDFSPPNAPAGFLQDILILAMRNMVEPLNYQIRKYLGSQITPVNAMNVWRHVDGAPGYLEFSQKVKEYVLQNIDSIPIDSQLDLIEETLQIFVTGSFVSDERMQIVGNIPISVKTAFPLYDLYFRVDQQKFSEQLDHIAQFVRENYRRFRNFAEELPKNVRPKDFDMKNSRFTSFFSRFRKQNAETTEKKASKTTKE